MCLILFAHRAHPEYPLVLAANRDEYHDRPTAPAARWDDGNDIFGGRDLLAGGSWLAISERGRMAAVTNYRDGLGASGERSRGALVSDFVASAQPIDEHLAGLEATGSRFGGFNLLLFESDDMYYVSNRGRVDCVVPPGIHGLSNHLLNTYWPKVKAGTAKLESVLKEAPNSWIKNLLSVLSDSSTAADDDLPRTGVSREWEKQLSAAFIRSPRYGTRASTVLLLRRDRRLEFVERSFDSEGNPSAERHHHIDNFGASSRTM